MDKFIKELTEAFDGIRSPSEIFHFSLTDSTNERARRYPNELLADSCAKISGEGGVSLFVADCQSQGRGRLNRRFVSNANAGLYMSIKFPYREELSRAVGITPLAAVAVCRAIEGLCEAKPKIKWVNDIYLGEKKLSGILTESTVKEDGTREFICGIGVNLTPSDMPSEVAEIATDLLTEGYSVSRAALCAKITEEFLSGIDKMWSKEFIEEYKRRSFVIGRSVVVHCAGEEYSATATAVTDNYELLVSLPDGTERRLSAGEVSIKSKP